MIICLNIYRCQGISEKSDTFVRKLSFAGSKLMKNIQKPLTYILFVGLISTILSSCGGGGSSSTTSAINIQQISGLNSPTFATMAPSGDVLVIDQGLVKDYSQLGVTFLQSFTLGSTGTGTTPFINPIAVAEDGNGAIYVADAGTDTISVFKSSSGKYSLYTSFGSQGSGNGQFLQPNSIAVDSSGSIYVSDSSNNNVQIFKPSGSSYAFSLVLSGGVFFTSPSSVAVDLHNNIFIADKSAKKIWVFSSIAQLLGTIGAPGTSAGDFSDPESVATDLLGNVYVADPTNQVVDKFTGSNGKYSYSSKVGSSASSIFQYITPVAVGVSSTQSVAVLDSTTKIVTVYPGGV